MRRIVVGALVLGVLGGVAGCGQAANPNASGASSTTPPPSPTITATPSPTPVPTGTPPAGMMPRGIPMFRELEAYAATYADALSAELDRIEPGHAHLVTCTSVQFLWWTGAHTPCQVTTDGGTPVRWTALTREHPDPPGGGSYVEFTVGERKDVNPWPPILPSATPAAAPAG